MGCVADDGQSVGVFPIPYFWPSPLLYTDGNVGYRGQDVLPGNLRLPDECARFREGDRHARAAGVSPGSDGGRSWPGPLQHLFHPRQGRAEGFQPAGRLQEAEGAGQAVRRPRLRGSTGRRKGLRARPVRFPGLRFRLLPQSPPDVGAVGGWGAAYYRARRSPDRPLLRDRIHRSHQSAPRLHHDHRGMRQVLRLLRGSVHPRQGAQPHLLLGSAGSAPARRSRLHRDSTARAKR